MADKVPPSPQDWEDIPFGPGQEHLPLGHLQHTHEGDALRGTDVRRKPGYESLIITDIRPERPA